MIGMISLSVCLFVVLTRQMAIVHFGYVDNLTFLFYFSSLCKEMKYMETGL